MKNLSPKEIEQLKAALNYLTLGELKRLCKTFEIFCRGKKGEVIKSIFHFLRLGKQLKPSIIPNTSKAKKGESYPLAPDTLILQGSYKNDVKTRHFLKQLVGDHFHFTAFGQDWIKERWFAGKPPTYREFANFWAKEKDSRQKKPATPKKEWAYLNFVQRQLKEHRKVSKNEIATAWKKERLFQVKKARKLVKKAAASN